MKRLFFIILFLNYSSAYGVLAGGRPNAISGGQNAFAGVVNPANAVWIEDRVDVGGFLVLQNSSFNNLENNPLFPPGKTNLAYKEKTLFTMDLAFHKRFQINCNDCSISLAGYTTPTYSKLRTKKPLFVVGTTPVFVLNKTQVISAIFSFKLNPEHSVGVSLDYFYLSHLRNGFQRSDNPLRSVAPGHVTNNGRDHSGGFGISLGWRWKISNSLFFGAAFIKKSYVGQFRKYKGYEPHFAHNFIPTTAGAGFTYLFSEKIAGRLEVLWTDLGNLPEANNSFLPNGRPNLHKRGSRKSPGAGLQDSTFINLGLGYHINSMWAVGAGFSHRIKYHHKKSNLFSHSYHLQTIYNLLALGVNFKWEQNDFFFTYAHGFENRVSGNLPEILGSTKMIFTRSTNSFSVAWGYLF